MREGTYNTSSPLAFTWKRYLAIAGSVLAIHVMIMVGQYLRGRSFNSLSAFSIETPVTLSLLILFPLLLVFLGKGILRLARRQEPRQKAWLLFLPIFAFALVRLLPVPDFNQAAASTLGKKASSAELVSLARSIIESPPAWMAGGPDSRAAKERWFRSTSPLDRLDLTPPWRMEIKDRSVCFYWGSPLSQNWGIAISADPGTQPVIPANHYGETPAIAAYPEAWIFSLSD
jgi:hypothetical protein